MMKIKSVEIEINSDAPFANCKLGRAKYADILTQIVGGYKEGFVLAVNGEWGTGKTTFIKMWEHLLKSKGYPTLYFNSWENDFDANPLTAMMSELKSLTKADTKETFRSVIEKGAILTKNVVPKLLKAVASRYIDIDVVKDVIEDTAEGTVEIFSAEIKEYAEKKAGLKDFKISLEKFVRESSDGKPIIFIIDELDRCRPNYAVEVLEQVKHFFAVPGIIFVLSIDKTQLGHAIRGVYGNDRINSEEYLRRFIDIEYALPLPNTKEFCTYLYEYFGFDSFLLSEERLKFSQFQSDKSTFIDLGAMLFEKAGLNLRQHEKTFAHARIGLIFFKSNQYFFPALYLLLVFLRNFQRELYNKIRLRVLTNSELVTAFESILPKGIDIEYINTMLYAECQLLYMYNNSFPEHERKPLLERVKSSDEFTLHVTSRFDTSANNNVFLGRLKDVIQSMDRNERRISLTYLMDKIDLIDNISTEV